ncbi:YihY family inner membrane protein [Pseudomonas sp. L-22-4S-12]|uniref:YihY family inner membrane protein n=1 Tax=Pseudomonas sp. L-22-4S-12 TaxID=2610893 RepID=UPI0013244BAF|nr:YihY family inner membrane protein [Pseudomonas sp. L-22-4S-12]MWV17872.1 YihY family inner membrane protein [Pseudomonas sp. L-22-4S-12]
MRQRLEDVTEFWRFLVQRFFADRATQSAAALTYTTLFAVVPMMTVTFAMLSAIPVFQGMGEDIQSFIFRNFVPSSGATVQEYLREFTVQARKLTWAGVILLALTAFMMLVTIEKAFNTIWRVRQPRRGVSSFLLYWAILSLGPLLLGVGFAVSTYITSLSLLSGPHALIGAKTLLGFAPLLSSVAAFTLIYATVPNARVPLRNALLGGLFTAVLFEVAKALFGLFVSLFPGYQLIYGAFATVPLFLLWIYVSWLIVLFGAELVCNLTASRHWRRRALPRLLVLLGILRVFHERQLRGVPLRHGDVQREGWLLPEDEWEEVLDFLEGEHLVCRVSGGGGWVLCRDLEHFSLHQLLSRSPWPLPRPGQLPDKLDDEVWYPGLRRALEMLHEEQAALFSGSLAQWLRGAD